MSKLIAAISLKGGTGKTTLILNLAGSLVIAGHKIVVIDTDPQGSAFSWSKLGQAPFKVISLNIEIGAVGFKQKLKELTSIVEFVLIDTPPQLATAAMLAALLGDILLIHCSNQSSSKRNY